MRRTSIRFGYDFRLIVIGVRTCCYLPEFDFPQEKEFSKIVDLREKRKKISQKQDIRMVISEAALYSCFGPPEIMKNQIEIIHDKKLEALRKSCEEDESRSI